MRAKLWLGGVLCALLAMVIYENVYLAGKETAAPSQKPTARTPMVSLDKAKLQMVYFWGDCNCHENLIAEEIADQRGQDVHSRIVRLEDPDRAALMRRYRVDKGPYTVFVNPKTGKGLMTMRFATYDDYQEALHGLLIDAGYGFSDNGAPVARGAAKVGKPAPEINVIAEASIGVNLEQYRGQKVVLVFVCGCDLCKRLVPQLNELVRREGHDKATVLAIGAFSTEGRDRFKADTKAEFSVCIDPDRKTIIRYASEACPRLWLVDEQGVIRYTNNDIRTPPARLAAELRRELGA
jgi:peroxiredoxin